ncbi:MAG: efflux RND transporter periplasmic adaptor subunit [Geminicoccaceae bacterium]
MLQTGSLLKIALTAVTLGAMGYAFWEREDRPAATSASPPPVPVQIAVATRRDVPVHLEDLGTVEPFNTVTIRSRVDGELQQVLFAEGQDIRQGDLLAVIDPRTFQAALDQAKARLDQDTAHLTNAQLNLGRDAQLGQRQFLSTQAVDNQRSQVAQLEAQIEEDKAMISTAETQLSYTRISSPIDGRAGLRLVDVGNIVHANDTTGLVVINQIHPVAVISSVPERDVSAVRTALAAGPVEVQALSREDGTVLDTGKVELTDNAIDPASGTLRLKSVFPNRQDRLWPGQFVDVRVLVDTLKDVLTVPADAIQRGPDGVFVFVVAPDQTVSPVPVTPGPIADGIAVIDHGLVDEARVVTQGQYRLAAGTQVVAAKPQTDQ